jgi:hypothetical protein
MSWSYAWPETVRPHVHAMSLPKRRFSLSIGRPVPFQQPKSPSVCVALSPAFNVLQTAREARPSIEQRVCWVASGGSCPDRGRPMMVTVCHW